MQKTPALFDDRNTVSKMIEFKSQTVNDVKVGEFWWYYEGVNIGSEISKDGLFKRPCLVLQNNMGNGLLLVIPLTTKFYIHVNKYSVDLLGYEIFGLRKSRLLLNHIKLIDPKRIEYCISQNKAGSGFIKKILYLYHHLCIKKNLP